MSAKGPTRAAVPRDFLIYLSWTGQALTSSSTKFSTVFFGHGKITDIGTVSFRWILPFWYFCFISAYKASLALYAERKQKYQNGNIHRKLTVPTSEREGKLSNPRARAARAPCREKIYENLRKPAHARLARAMHWFCRNQEYSTCTARQYQYAIARQARRSLVNWVLYL